MDWSCAHWSRMRNGPSPTSESSNPRAMCPVASNAAAGNGRNAVYPSADGKSMYGAESVTWNVYRSIDLSPVRGFADGAALASAGFIAPYPAIFAKYELFCCPFGPYAAKFHART